MFARLLAPCFGALLTLVALSLPASAQQEFKIGVVMSLSGGFVAMCPNGVHRNTQSFPTTQSPAAVGRPR